MSSTFAIHPHTAPLTPRVRIRALVLGLVAVATAVTLALALFTAGAQSNGRLAPSSFHNPSSAAPLGLVRDAKTGQWTCVRVKSHPAAASRPALILR